MDMHRRNGKQSGVHKVSPSTFQIKIQIKQ